MGHSLGMSELTEGYLWGGGISIILVLAMIIVWLAVFDGSVEWV